jgi:3-deoxy-D-manno-octulosonic-acid transferase
VRDAVELEKAVGELLTDEPRREQMGRHALEVVHENLGGIERTVEMIVGAFEGSELYLAPKKQLPPS